MTNTTYYNLNIVEGTDIVNPLTVDNPNYEKIDEVMHDNAVSGVTLASEIANATVHAITRENSECAVIRFIATSNWKAGDTVTVDGVPVAALLPSGETLPDGAYVINANVLCVLTGTNLTVYAERKKVDNASELSYKETTVEVELDRINEELKSGDETVRTLNISKIENQYASLDNSSYAYVKNGVCYTSLQVNVLGNYSGWAIVGQLPVRTAIDKDEYAPCADQVNNENTLLRILVDGKIAIIPKGNATSSYYGRITFSCVEV